MERVIIVGTTGSGKSTLAQQIAGKLKLAHIEPDHFHHLPGWQERPTEEFRRLIGDATQAQKWVISGNYSKSQDITWPRADTIIWVDMPFAANFMQLFKRSIARAYTREPVCNGNTETFSKLFLSRESILWWFLKTWRKNRKKYSDIFTRQGDYPHLRFIRLTSYKQSREFIDSAA